MQYRLRAILAHLSLVKGGLSLARWQKDPNKAHNSMKHVLSHLVRLEQLLDHDDILEALPRCRQCRERDHGYT